MATWKISRRLIDRILTDYQPGEAITAIDSYLAPRVPSELELGFTRPEMNLRMFCIYSGDVGNGGNSQFFLNPGGCYAGRAVVALREMSLGSPERILRRSIEVFPGGRVPPDRYER
jgi:hypothetical protein